ncbi:acyl-CoA ligase (AMP-forming), exosortase A system-associated [Psychrobium sp. 1_MG-2023]|uniref:acyl-CoA ligase (AMP-forming), exosortase A system-associated n=1 Tax=Psychrobium sp. 1_MG-2023 TaxID=3062624 RepID=UPI000C3232D9|nr:acyl-CoA ligase (AMP-forming), exosortase A system-associated [Psychrobium sp. 1_MG-2023]MDP2561303.1 acyl-CoA ligase (AMP-forming), exosortase A system-associated [Psychrobium sp. 1_MG-2023]PKF54119.1 acyl-CoA ligase (AMP-forming), exosortase A system-associated [Alteromonadales bacterium alter-6D02]
MSIFLHQLISDTAKKTPNQTALSFKNQQVSYQQLDQKVQACRQGMCALQLPPLTRIAVFLPKTIDAVVAIFGASAAGFTFVPINHVLKPPQVEHIITDCEVKVLITNKQRWKQLLDAGINIQPLTTVVLTDLPPDESQHGLLSWQTLQSHSTSHITAPVTGNDMVAILYTSGSTGAAKGVVLSHQNILCGARSVAQYLENSQDDVILALLPLSFDYGLSQLTTAFYVGAHCVLMDYLLPNDVIQVIQNYRVTGLAGVPPLWAQLMKANWPKGSDSSLRYWTNSGGAMPEALLLKLRTTFKQASPYLMYGLTEAFRSTYLPPELIDTHQNSIGKAIPNAEVMVINEQGKIAKDGELGELVHRGPLVSLGYWNAPEKTHARFKQINSNHALSLPEYAVFSGDWVHRDRDGFMYFVGRKDDMIKSSGYRISPSEIEEVIYKHPLIIEAAALGVPHPELGQGLIIIYKSVDDENIDSQLVKDCKGSLANFMQPLHYIQLHELAHNANGKIDRARLSKEYMQLFTQDEL